MTNTLIIGGSSGLGLEIGEMLSKESEVYITGRKNPSRKNMNFQYLELHSELLCRDLDNLIEDLPTLDSLFYTAGYFQEGKIDDLSDDEILKMNYVGLVSAELLIQRILKKQNKLEGFVVVTSTSEYTPREREPVYTGAKAGIAMFAKSVSKDERLGKVLVAAPAGMKTAFWRNSPRDMSTFLEPRWVAEKILEEYNGDFSYKCVDILREPPRVTVREQNQLIKRTLFS